MLDRRVAGLRVRKGLGSLSSPFLLYLYSSKELNLLCLSKNTKTQAAVMAQFLNSLLCKTEDPSLSPRTQVTKVGIEHMLVIPVPRKRHLWGSLASYLGLLGEAETSNKLSKTKTKPQTKQEHSSL